MRRRSRSCARADQGGEQACAAPPLAGRALGARSSRGPAGRSARARKQIAGARSPARTLSVREEELPAPWRHGLAAGAQRGCAPTGAPPSAAETPTRPAAARSGGIVRTVAAAGPCTGRADAGIALDEAAVTRWLDAAREPGNAPAGLFLPLRTSVLWQDEKVAKWLTRRLAALAAGEIRQVGLGHKRKDRKLGAAALTRATAGPRPRPPPAGRRRSCLARAPLRGRICRRHARAQPGRTAADPKGPTDVRFRNWRNLFPDRRGRHRSPDPLSRSARSPPVARQRRGPPADRRVNGTSAPARRRRGPARGGRLGRAGRAGRLGPPARHRRT